MDRLSTILDDIDAGRLMCRTHQVARRLADHETRSGVLGAEIVAAFDAGDAVGNDRLLEQLWMRIDSLPPSQQGSLRILVSLLRSDEPLDGHLAEYLIGWAQDEGVPANAIEAAFQS